MLCVFIKYKVNISLVAPGPGRSLTTCNTPPTANTKIANWILIEEYSKVFLHSNQLSLNSLFHYSCRSMRKGLQRKKCEGKYQPTSPSSRLQRMINPGGSKIADSVWKRIVPIAIGCSDQVLKNEFFDFSSYSMRKT